MPKRIAQGFSRQRMVVLPRPVVTAAMGESITSTLLPTDAGHFISAASHYIERPHGISQCVLIYCICGGGWAEIGGERLTIRQGQLLILPPGVPHRYGAAEREPWTIYWSHVAGSGLPCLLESLGVRRGKSLLMTIGPHRIVPLLEQVITALEADYNQPTLLGASLAVGYLFQQLLAQRSVGSADDLGERIEATVEVMQRKIGGHLRIDDLAAIAKLSPSHYATVFRRRTGYAVLDYFIRMKMREACRLLDTTGLPIKIIAGRLGYDDPLYFSRAFNKVMAVSPRDYRSMRKG